MEKKPGKKVEILAPAGSIEAMIGAVNGGCDAVYMGGQRFGARASADNPDERGLLRALDFMHLHGKKLYLTVNTLVKEKEFEQLCADLLPLYREGLDGAIVQDMGVARFLRERFPLLPVHASTQMSITGIDGVRAVQAAGIRRVVLARELSLEEIGRIRSQTGLELETFVHGALCFCYSGQCLMSSMIGGRSGNRGRCAQPCRLPYTLVDLKENRLSAEGAYLLSPKDICTLSILPDLIDAGIDSFKIEGRMKRPEYAAYTSAVYRAWTDKYLELGRERYERYREEHGEEFGRNLKNLADIYNRGGFTSGFYTGDRKNRIAAGRPGHYGVPVGTVKSVDEKSGMARLSLTEEVHGQDVLEIRRGEEALYEFTVKSAAAAGTELLTKYRRGIRLDSGNPVYRTKNEELLSEIRTLYLSKERKQEAEIIFLAYLGMNATLTLKSAGYSVTVTGEPVAPAQKQPLSEEDLKRQLRKTGNTPFEITEITLFTEPGIFIPVGQLNELRRRAVQELEQSVLQKYRREEESGEARCPAGFEIPERKAEPGSQRIVVSVMTREQLKAAAASKETSGVYLSAAAFTGEQLKEGAVLLKEAGKEVLLTIPTVFRQKDREKLERELKGAFPGYQGMDGFVVRNYEALTFAREKREESGKKLKLVLDYTMYVWNWRAFQTFSEWGADRFSAPVELSFGELSGLPMDFAELVVYGHLPLMTTAHCILPETEGCHRQGQIYRLTDRYRKSFYVIPFCSWCYSVIYNGQALCLADQKKEIGRLSPSAIRLDFSVESGKETERILKFFADVFRYNKERDYLMKDVTRGHFKHTVK